MIWRLAGLFVRGVLIGLIPVGINWVMAYMFEEPTNMATLLGRGELLLLSFGLLLGALGDIIRVRPGWTKTKTVASGFSAAVIFVIGVVYVPVTYPGLLEEQPSATSVAVLSLALYIFAFVVSMAILYAAEESANV